MVLEVPLGIVLTLTLANRRFTRAVLIAGVCGIAAVIPGLVLSGSTDVVSNQLRAESYSVGVNYFAHNLDVLFVGANVDQFREMVNASLTYGVLIPADAPTHNLLIETAVSGGLLSLVGLIVLVLAPAVSVVRSAHRVGRFGRSQALVLSGIVLAVLEASVTPTVANAAPFWIMLGCAIAVAAYGQSDAPLRTQGSQPWLTPGPRMSDWSGGHSHPALSSLIDGRQI